jgi:hypothetical protein
MVEKFTDAKSAGNLVKHTGGTISSVAKSTLPPSSIEEEEGGAGAARRGRQLRVSTTS